MERLPRFHLAKSAPTECTGRGELKSVKGRVCAFGSLLPTSAITRLGSKGHAKLELAKWLSLKASALFLGMDCRMG